MNVYEKQLKDYILSNDVKAEHLVFERSCHSVKDAAETVGATPKDFVKNICMIDVNDNLIVAIVGGEDRASTSRVAKALGIERPRTAKPEEILKRTGYPCGGTPSFGYQAKFLIDPKVMEMEMVYTGGGSENSLVKIAVEELQKANQAEIVRVRK